MSQMSNIDNATARTIDGDSTSLDLVFEILSDRWCRFVLYAVTTADDDVTTVDQLLEEVQALVDGDGHTPSKTLFKHQTLPKLSDVGIIEYDPRSETVRCWEVSSMREWLDHARYVEDGP